MLQAVVDCSRSWLSTSRFVLTWQQISVVFFTLPHIVRELTRGTVVPANVNYRFRPHAVMFMMFL